MQTIYKVKIHDRILESRDLKRLLARAVSEKRNMDQKIRLLSSPAALNGASKLRSRRRS